MTPILELKAVRKVFKSDVFKPAKVAVDDLSFALNTGTCTGLLGPNGAGKTTTLRLILGHIKPDRGQIHFAGKPLQTRDRRDIGFMPEINKLPAALTVEEILAQQLRLMHGVADRQRLTEQLAQVGLSGERKKRLGQLSKGMARRVAWSQAVIHAPQFLILDEPGSGLDPVAQRHLVSWIAAEKRRGATILLCTHELPQVQALCDQLLILNQGKVVLSTIGQDPGYFAAPWAYEIHISGDGEDGLRQLAAQQQLPTWQSLRQHGFLAILGFNEYADATRWLKVLLASERAVLRFGEPTGLSADELLSYFER